MTPEDVGYLSKIADRYVDVELKIALELAKVGGAGRIRF